MNRDGFYALATGSGGAIAIVRVNGNGCVKKLLPHLKSHQGNPLKIVKPRYAHYLQWWDLERHTALDDVCLLFFEKGKSYTGDDLVELHLHGSRAIIQRTFEILSNLGFEPAKPGEFTQRAFLNGKLSLTQAEAVRELIESDHLQQAKIALSQLKGGLKSKIESLRDQLIDIAAHLEATLDYPEEDIDFIDSEQLIRRVLDSQKVLNLILASYDRFHYFREGISVAIIGHPNAGKSSLLNCLLKTERAIVTEIEGTTRDHIEEVMELEGFKFRLIDTAGIRESKDKVERLGIERSIEIEKQSDIQIYMYDGSKSQKIPASKSNSLHVLNKSDLQLDSLNSQFLDRDDVIQLSVNDVYGFDQLESWLLQKARELVGTETYDELPVLTNQRQKNSMQLALQNLSDFTKALSIGIPMDIALVELYACLDSLGEITGEVKNTDILDRLFEKFCIGK